MIVTVGCGGRGLDGHQGFLADIETLPHEETPSFFLRKVLPESQIKVCHLRFGSSQQLPSIVLFRGKITSNWF